MRFTLKKSDVLALVAGWVITVLAVVWIAEYASTRAWMVLTMAVVTLAVVAGEYVRFRRRSRT